MKEKAKALITDMTLSLPATKDFYKDANRFIKTTKDSIQAAYKNMEILSIVSNQKKIPLTFFALPIFPFTKSIFKTIHLPLILQK